MARSAAPLFIRVGSHLVNVEAIGRVQLLKNDDAELILQGNKKGLQRLLVPGPAGRQLWEFLLQNLAVVEFDDAPETPAPVKKTKDKVKQKASKAAPA